MPICTSKQRSEFGEALMICELLVQTYLQFEEIQACHSHTLFILRRWPVQVPNYTFTNKAQKLVEHSECFFADIHYKRNTQIDSPLTITAPSKTLKPRDAV
jgi:hypothetical protein